MARIMSRVYDCGTAELAPTVDTCAACGPLSEWWVIPFSQPHYFTGMIVATIGRWSLPALSSVVTTRMESVFHCRVVIT